MTRSAGAGFTPANALDEARRTYWTRALDEASNFMSRAIEVPVKESLEPALDLVAVLPSSLDVEFAGPDGPNRAGMFYLRRSLVPMLTAVIQELNGLGLAMMIEFGYRTPQTQAELCRSATVLGKVLESTTWEAGERPSAELVYRRLVVLCANVYKTGTHLGASALDVSLIDRETGVAYDHGGQYLTFDARTPFESPYVSTEARRRRALVRSVFARHGFVAYPYEFWHFCAGDVFEAIIRQSQLPARFGPVHVDADNGNVTPVEQPERELVPKEIMLQRIEALLDEFEAAR